MIVKALAAAGLGLCVFAWWGTSTAGGRRAFDEMAGILPLAAGALGGLLLLSAAVLAWRRP